MVKYRRIKNTRPKAFVGESIVAAGIGAAATLASAAISSAATTAGAKRQALAQQQAAQTQAEALKKQNDNANKLQEKQIEFTQKENEQNRDLQNQIQMNLQMLQGQQNENARLDAARIQVKKGGNPFMRAGLSSFLQAGNNMPFEVTDGGYAMPIGVTPQGYDLYELRGDNHEQYHKTRGGKYKSGVGIKAATGQIVEGEGGKRNAQGELIMVTPYDIKFISKHSLHGFNPTNAVLNGLDPQVAYNEQELIKAYNNSPVKKNKYKNGGPSIHIKPENRGKFTTLQERTGKSATWFKENGTPAERKMATFAINARKWNKRKAGGNSVALFDLSNPINFSTDTIAPTVGGIEYIMNNREKQKCGGRMKRAGGGPYSYYNRYNQFTPPSVNQLAQVPDHIMNMTPADIVKGTNNGTLNISGELIKASDNGYQKPTQINTQDTSKKYSLSSDDANLIGAGITGASSLLAGGITSLGNYIASKYARRGLIDATNATIEGARRLRTVNPDLIRRSDFAAAHAMPALIDTRVNLNPQLASVERATQRLRRDISRGSSSAAAGINRYANAETNAYDQRSKIYSTGLEYLNHINEFNAKNIQDASLKNAAFDNQAGQDYLQSKLDLAKYNNDIVNKRIGIEYAAKADLATGLADVLSSKAKGNAQTWANVNTTTGNAFASAIQQNAKNYEDWNANAQGKQYADAFRDFFKKHPGATYSDFENWWQNGRFVS